jgi:hypothetical protein
MNEYSPYRDNVRFLRREERNSLSCYYIWEYLWYRYRVLVPGSSTTVHTTGKVILLSLLYTKYCTRCSVVYVILTCILLNYVSVLVLKKYSCTGMTD